VYNKLLISWGTGKKIRGSAKKRLPAPSEKFTFPKPRKSPSKKHDSPQTQYYFFEKYPKRQKVKSSLKK